MEHSAKDAISGLSLKAANYDDAIAILEKKFGNKQQIISKNMVILLNVEAVASTNNMQTL